MYYPVPPDFWQPFFLNGSPVLLNEPPFLQKTAENGKNRPWQARTGRSSLSKYSNSTSFSVATSFFPYFHTVFPLLLACLQSFKGLSKHGRRSVDSRSRVCRSRLRPFLYFSHQNLFTDGQFGRSLVQHHPKIPLQYSFCSYKWKDTVANQFCNTLTHCVAVEQMGRARKTRKEDGAGVEKGAKRQKLQQTLGDSSTALLSAASPLSTAPTDEDMFGDLHAVTPLTTY